MPSAETTRSPESLAMAGSPQTLVGADLKVADGSWSFRNAVAGSFVDHVRRSVPLYDAGHELVAELAGCFVRPGGLGYELGTATGQLLRCLATHSARTRSASWVGIEYEAEMVTHANRYCADLPNIQIVEGDVATANYEQCDFVADYLTLQFLDLGARSRTVRRIHSSLRDGGGFFMYTKVLMPESRLQDLATILYHRFKRNQGLSPEELLNKADSVVGILQPMTSLESATMLTEAGFHHVSPILRYLCFEGYLAVKR